ncbi:MAG: hypothetical protein ACTSPB_12910 [Candidatus Thorarchaeota archaeon]
MNLRHQIEADLADTLEGEFALPVELISPTGETQIYKKGSTTELLSGQLLFDIRSVDPDTGMPIVVHKPVVVLRLTSLDRKPRPGEKWAVKIRSSITAGASMVAFVLEQATEDGQSIGFIRLYLTRPQNKES